MRLIGLAVISLLSLTLAPLLSGAQQAGKIWRVGYLANVAQPPDARPPLAFRDGLKDLGYIEGQNITYIGRWAEAKSDRLPRLAEELVRSNVDDRHSRPSE